MRSLQDTGGALGPDDRVSTPASSAHPPCSLRAVTSAASPVKWEKCLLSRVVGGFNELIYVRSLQQGQALVYAQ